MTIRFTYYGHAALGLNLDGVQLLVDPAFSDMPYDIGLAQSLAPDYICITHGHGDHVGDAVAIAERSGATLISNAEICGWLSEKGLKPAPTTWVEEDSILLATLSSPLPCMARPCRVADTGATQPVY